MFHRLIAAAPPHARINDNFGGSALTHAANSFTPSHAKYFRGARGNKFAARDIAVLCRSLGAPAIQRMPIAERPWNSPTSPDRSGAPNQNAYCAKVPIARAV
jgi:hypothetical protein